MGGRQQVGDLPELKMKCWGGGGGVSFVYFRQTTVWFFCPGVGVSCWFASRRVASENYDKTAAVRAEIPWLAQTKICSLEPGFGPFETDGNRWMQMKSDSALSPRLLALFVVHSPHNHVVDNKAFFVCCCCTFFEKQLFTVWTYYFFSLNTLNFLFVRELTAIFPLYIVPDL